MYSVICICHIPVGYRINADFVSEYSREATILQRVFQDQACFLFTRISQELLRQILRRMKYNYGCLFVLRIKPSKQLRSCRAISYPLTLLLWRIRHTKPLTSTKRAYARGSI